MILFNCSYSNLTLKIRQTLNIYFFNFIFFTLIFGTSNWNTVCFLQLKEIKAGHVKAVSKNKTKQTLTSRSSKEGFWKLAFKSTRSLFYRIMCHSEAVRCPHSHPQGRALWAKAAWWTAPRQNVWSNSPKWECPARTIQQWVQDVLNVCDFYLCAVTLTTYPHSSDALQSCLWQVSNYHRGGSRPAEQHFIMRCILWFGALHTQYMLMFNFATFIYIRTCAQVHEKER